MPQGITPRGNYPEMLVVAAAECYNDEQEDPHGGIVITEKIRQATHYFFTSQIRLLHNMSALTVRYSVSQIMFNDNYQQRKDVFCYE